MSAIGLAFISLGCGIGIGFGLCYLFMCKRVYKLGQEITKINHEELIGFIKSIKHDLMITDKPL